MYIHAVDHIYMYISAYMCLSDAIVHVFGCCFSPLRPFMFRTQSKEVCESGTYQTVGMDVVATAERVILIDAQVCFMHGDGWQ